MHIYYIYAPTRNTYEHKNVKWNTITSMTVTRIGTNYNIYTVQNIIVIIVSQKRRSIYKIERERRESYFLLVIIYMYIKYEYMT